MPYTDFRRKSRSAAGHTAPRPRVRRPPSSFGYRGWDDHRLITPLLAQFIILSVLMHILGILLFGAPTGGSRQGRAMWGSLDVILADSYREPGPALKLERGLPLPGSAPRLAPPRPAARAAPAKPPPPAAPSAPEAPPEPAIVSTPAAAPVTVPPVVVPKMLERVPTPKASVEMAPAFEVPPPTPAPIETGAPLAPLPMPRADRSLAAPPVLDAPLVEPAPLLAPIPLPSVDRPLAAPPVLDAPLVQPAPDLVPLVAPRIERQLVAPPPIVAPVEEPLPAAPAAAPAPERSAPVPPQAPAMPSAAPEVPRRAAPSQPRAPAARPSDIQSLPQAAPREEGESLFRRPAAPPPSYDPTAPGVPKLDLDALGKRARELAREGSGNRAALPFPMPPVPPKKSKMEQAIENARKPDCRDAYKSLGLAAVVPLIANEFGEGTCRW